jgi:branched-chain amino acid transport system substrate-binding protein
VRCKQDRFSLSCLLAICCLTPLLSSCRPSTPEVLRIGAILPLSGKSAQYGRFIQEGLELAVSEVNAGEGIRGKKLAIIYEDDQANPNMAANAMKKLAEVNRVPIVFGSWASSSVLAEAPIAEKDHVIVMAEAVSPKIRDAGDYIFRIQPDGSYYMRDLAKAAYQRLGLRRIATLYVTNDFGVDLSAKFKEYFRELGGTVTSENGFEQGQADFRSYLTLIAGQKPDAIFIPTYTEAGQILTQARELGITQRFLAAATFENPEILRIAGQAAEGVVYPHHFYPDSPDPRVRAYQIKYRARYGRDSEGFAVLAYDGLHILADSLCKCGSDATCVKDYLYSVHHYAGVTGDTGFDEKGDVIKPIVIKVVRGGQFRVL